MFDPFWNCIVVKQLADVVVDLQNSKLLVSGRGVQGISLDTSIRQVQAKGGAEEADHRRALCRDKLQWSGKESASTETPQCPTCARSQCRGSRGLHLPACAVILRTGGLE
jgi:hypothetical protein